jgi:large subunit ribosomal protein L3
MIGILGRKIGMTQLFTEEGRVVPATVLSAGPCIVVNRRTEEKEGYNAVQIGYENAKKLNKPLMGYFRKQQIPPKKHLYEFRIDDPSSYEIGQKIEVDIFKKDEKVKVSGISKGRGFTGVVKRCGFSGGKKSHGSMFGRVPGSIGQSSAPSRVWKNIGMPGRMGGKRVTVRNLKVIKVDKERNLLFVKGAVPGPPKGLLIVQKER